MKRATLVLSALLAAAAVHAAPGLVAGVDVSSLPRVEAAGAAFSDSSGPADALTLLAAHGVRAVRVRVWVDPADGACSAREMAALAARARARGLGVLVDLHYSDTWADPGAQSKPRRWADARGRVLADSVRAWTRTTLAAFTAAGAAPIAVQVGNEISNGLLWPEGRLSRGGSSPEWARVAELLRAASAGVREGAPGARVLLHVDRGGDAAFVRRWFREIERRRVPYDDVALSYYPWWHGPLDSLAATLRTCGESLGRDVWIVETAHPWTTRWFDDTHNVVGAGADLRGRPATPEGQRAFLAELVALARRTPRVRGLFWWEPADVSAPRRGSAWENCALFDERGRLLPAAREWARGAKR